MPSYTARKAGIYRAKYLGCTERTVTDDDGTEKVMWLWSWQEVTDPTTAGVLSRFTGTSLQSKNSNAYKIAAGILSDDPHNGADTEAHVGELYDVIYMPNQAGNLAVIGCTAVGQPVTDSKSYRSEEEAAAAAAVPTPVTDDLPF
jgi:hypothetical protein